MRVWLEKRNRADDGRESHRGWTRLAHVFTGRPPRPSQLTYLTAARGGPPAAPGLPGVLRQGGISLPAPALPPSASGAWRVRCCCVPRVTLDIQGCQLRATVFLQGPRGFIFHNDFNPLSSLQASLLCTQQSPPQPFTPMPTFIIRRPGDFAENNFFF